jgi:hypothetical protein
LVIDDHFSEVVSMHLQREHGYPSDLDAVYGRDAAVCLACDSFFSVVRERTSADTMRCLSCWRAVSQDSLRRCASCDHWHTPTAAGDPGQCIDCGHALQ